MYNGFFIKSPMHTHTHSHNTDCSNLLLCVCLFFAAESVLFVLYFRKYKVNGEVCHRKYKKKN